MQLPAFSSEKDHVPFFKRIFANFPNVTLGAHVVECFQG